MIFTSYRPKSLLPIFTKLFERIFGDSLLQETHLKTIISHNQFDFRKKDHSTTEQIHRIQNFIRDAFDADVPWGSILGSFLYLLFTADMPMSLLIYTSTFVDDNAFIRTHKKPVLALRNTGTKPNQLLINKKVR